MPGGPAAVCIGRDTGAMPRSAARPMRRAAALVVLVAVAGCGGRESAADRVGLRKAERNLREAMQALQFENGPPKDIRVTCRKDDDRSFHCDYGFRDEIGGQCMRYSTSARVTITAAGEYRLDGPAGP